MITAEQYKFLLTGSWSVTIYPVIFFNLLSATGQRINIPVTSAATPLHLLSTNIIVQSSKIFYKSIVEYSYSCSMYWILMATVETARGLCLNSLYTLLQLPYRWTTHIVVEKFFVRKSYCASQSREWMLWPNSSRLCCLLWAVGCCLKCM